jgi:replication factor C large subunit
MTDQTQEPWVDRHRPTKISEIQGNNRDLDTIKNWADGWEPGDEPILLVGPPGVGKTSTAEAVANRLNLQTVEVNASTARATDDLRSMAAQIRTAGESGRRLILIDEVDSWHHGPDKTVLYDALDSPANPTIMTANDEYDVADGVKSRAETFEFSLGVRSRKAKISDVAAAEGLDLDDHEINTLADRPDLRSAINDLQMFAEHDRPISEDAREWEDSEWDVLDRVMTGTPDLGSLSPPDALMWLDESVSAEYRGLEMAMAYEAMAMADVQLGKARRDDYRYWRYAAKMIEEVALIRQTEPYYDDEVSYNNKSFPEWFRHSKPRADSDTSTARLYRDLKGDSGFEFAGNYTMFLSTYLPTLKGLDEEQKYEIVMSYRLDDDQMQELGVDPGDYESWLEVEEPEEGEWTGKVHSASEW